MDYKKLYEEALKRAKAAHNSAKSDKENGNKDKITEYTIQLTETIFPELKESEDEKSKKWILEYLYDGLRKSDEQFKDHFKAAIAWLEKQGEQKPTDKVEPKFKVGDWAVNQHGYTRQIIDIKNDCYYCIRTESSDSIENPWYGTINYVDEQWHKWTIQDAKDGDVLVYGDNPNDYHSEVIMIFKSLRSKHSAFTHFHIFDNKFRTDDWCDCGNNAHPATKEQCAILFAKMKEAGYMWDAEKKELRKIEKNPVWSEEDESNLQGIIDEIEANKHSAPDYDLVTYDRFLSWLKSLKDRLKGE